MRQIDQLCLDHLRDTKSYYNAIGRDSGTRGAYFDEVRGCWIVTSYDLCLKLLKESRLGKSRLSFADFGLPPETRAYVQTAQSIVDRQMVFSDSEDAKKSHIFWSKRLGERSKISTPHNMTIAQRFLRPIEDGWLDLYSDILRPYVSTCICQQLGISDGQREQLYPLVMGFAALLDGKIQDTREVWESVIAAVLLDQFVKQNCERLALASGVRDKNLDQWSADYILTLVAGHESTAYLLGVAILFAEWIGLDLLDSAAGRHRLILEALRFDPPVQIIGRIVVETIQIDPEWALSRGTRVLLHIGAAGRDGDHFVAPEVFDVQRKGANLAFGAYGGRCIGKSFALVEADIFLQEYGNWRKGRTLNFGRLSYRHGTAGRSFETMPVEVKKK